MGRKFLVHGVHFTTKPVKAKTEDGHDVEASMPVALIELVCPGAKGTSYTHTERALTDEDKAHIAATFPEGGIVEHGDFKLVERPAPKAKGVNP
jgi:hypothetical protein